MMNNNGLILINKPKGYTSRDIVNIISKKYNTKKVGHTGTLDPLATGVLVIALNKYTKLCDKLMTNEKEYTGEIELGFLTDTLDITGKKIDSTNNYPTKEEVEKVFNTFPKSYLQEVPLYSAVKINGKKLYEYARNNLNVELPKKEVNIYSLKLISYNDKKIKFITKVSKGTYIRSLIKDICSELNTLGTMSNLTRTSQGIFSIDECQNIDDKEFKLLKFENIFPTKIIELDNNIASKIKNGNKINLSYNDQYILFVSNNVDIALYELNNSEYHLLILF